MTPYYSDDLVTLYHGDCREVLPTQTVPKADAIIADPPYAETALEWDNWPDGWVDHMADVANSMWCFGSMRMFLERRDEFHGWRMSQDIVWEKHNGSGFATDRFKRVHEVATHWYRGPWSQVTHDVPRVARTGPSKNWKPSGKPQSARSEHTGEIGPRGGYQDDGSRMQRSVIRVPSTQGRAIHPTEKPIGIVAPLIEYACGPGGLVVDPFAGSGTTFRAAKDLGRRAIGVEINERYCEIAARRCQQESLNLGGAA